MEPRISIIDSVRNYFKLHKFATVGICAEYTRLTTEQVKSAIVTMRNMNEIEYRGNHRKGFYVLKGYNNGLDEGSKRRRRGDVSDAKIRYVDRIRTRGEILPDISEGEDQDGLPDDAYGKYSWEVLSSAKRVLEE